MFERFTERARQVVVLAQDEVREFKHNRIGTEHLLLGLLREEEGLGAMTLAACGVTLDEARGIVGASEAMQNPPVGQIPFTESAKKALELALREALGMGHNYIGTEHVLLGLARDSDNIASRIMLAISPDATHDKLRQAIIDVLSPKKKGPPANEERIANLCLKAYAEGFSAGYEAAAEAA